MEVILTQDVDNVGLRGEVVNVARGYARNFLLPRRLAEVATPAKVAELEKRDSQRARHEARSVEHAREIAELLGKTVLRFEVKAGPTGALFGSVTPTDIADEIWRVRKVRVDRRKIELPEPIKRIGRSEVSTGWFVCAHSGLIAPMATGCTGLASRSDRVAEPRDGGVPARAILLSPDAVGAVTEIRTRLPPGRAMTCGKQQRISARSGR